MSTSGSDFIRWFRSAAPYIHAHRGKTFVLHFGGELVQSKYFSHFLHDIALLNSLGIRLVIVYGARPQIESLLKERNLKTQIVGNLRVTDATMLASVKEAVGSMRVNIEALLSMGLPNSPMADASVKVTSGNFVTAKPFGILEGVDLQYTGTVRSIDTVSINSELDNDGIVLIPPLGYSPTGEVFNLSSVEVATDVAINLQADKLLYLVPGEGLKNKSGESLHQITQLEAKQILAKTSKLDESPYKQLQHGLKACAQGVDRIHFIDQKLDGGLLQELFSRDGVGILLSATPFDVIRLATINEVGGILELIQPLEEQGTLVRRSREKLEMEINNYYVLMRDSTVIACAALHIYDIEDIAELACLAVDADYQKVAKGKILYSTIEKEAASKGVKKIFVLTTQATHWFLEQGFNEAAIDDLPISKQDLYNYKRNSKALIKYIK
jgi:amino-acid N-acetyltransferase